MNFLKRTLGSLRWTNTGTWIGANSRSGGVWRWTTGERLQWGYWAPGQPSKSLGLFSIEDCALMKRQDGYRWHDYHCDTDMFYKYRSVCDFRMSPRTTTTTTTTASTTTSASTTVANTTLASAPTTEPPPSTQEPELVVIHVPKLGPNHDKPKILESQKMESGYRKAFENAHIDPDQASSTGDRQLESDNSTDKDSLLIGFISGAVVVLLLAVFAFIFCRKRFQRKKPMDEMSVRFENLNYARVDQRDQGPQRAQSNIYMDTSDMNRLYDVVTKQVDHGVNRYDTQYTSTLQAKGAAEGGKDMCCSEDPGYETPLKKCPTSRDDNPPAPPLPCLNNRRPKPVQECEYVDMSAGSRQGKATNLINEANRVVDPCKPSNLEQRVEPTDQPMYANDNAVNEALEEHGSEDEIIQPFLGQNRGESAAASDAEQIYETVQ
ncbi:uncharacterized protein LOC117337442 isoform X1 [Pecten maximus]|uniref:uncharacterized protein LOC117337442 isoform X1 n=1 Tax=Pecten maximus TaxID=6579 RepID=UPI00145803A8|nr:uncharacterized protein LOC117337442 isoform X1 [Pecten maximus]